MARDTPAASRLCVRFRSTLWQLSTTASGKARRLAPELVSYRPEYLIFYRRWPDGVEIARILMARETYRPEFSGVRFGP